MQPHDRRKIITPAEAIARAIIRPRSAPKPKPVARLSGRLAWSLIGRDGREKRAGEQSNLITNGGLDHIASSPWTSATHLDQLAVGTGSAAPDVTDTALDAQIAITSMQLTAPTFARTGDGVYEKTTVFEFGFDEANGNLTEFGIKGSASDGAPLLARELFRDEADNPTPLTKTSAYKLRLTYTVTLALSPVTATAGSFTIAGVGLVNGDYAWCGGNDEILSSGGAYDLKGFVGLATAAADPSDTDSGGAFVANAAHSFVYSDNSPSAVDARAASALTYSTYTAGDYSRGITQAVWGTANGNVDPVEGIGLIASAGATGRAAFIFQIDEADRFTKDDLHTLTIEDVCTVSWGRAA